MTFQVHSILQGMTWPGIADARAAHLLALQFQLDHTQWLSPPQIERLQWAQLERVLAHALATVPYYRDLPWAQRFLNSKSNWRAAWSELPILNRREVQLAGEALISIIPPPDHGTVTRHVSSGSTGRPIHTVSTELSHFFWNAITLRDHLWHRRDFGGTLAAIRSRADHDAPAPDGIVTEGWGTGTNGIVQTGPCAILDVQATVQEQVDWLMRIDPHYLLTYPSNAVAVGREFLAAGLRLSRLVEVRTFGEVLESHARQICRQAWDVPVVDVYSADEVGYIALECPDHEGYHVQAEHLFVEVLDDSNQPCKPGEIGRVIVTTLNNFAMPLLRYEIGDYAEVGSPCACGRGLPVLKRILGRQRNMLVLPDGQRRWPALEIGRFRMDAAELPPVEQFQLIQRTTDSLELLLVAQRRLSEAEEQLVRFFVHDALGHPFALTISYVTEIPRGPTGKYEDFRCEVDSTSEVSVR